MAIKVEIKEDGQCYEVVGHNSEEIFPWIAPAAQILTPL